MPDYRGGGGGGGGFGGGRQRGGPRGFEPEELAFLFQRLAEASGQLFIPGTGLLLTEQSAHDLLTGSFEALANACRKGRLPDIVEQMWKMAGEQRVIATRHVGRSEKQWKGLPLFNESVGQDIVKKITDCLVPPAPR